MVFICGLVLTGVTIIGIAGCKKTPLLEEIEGIREGLGRWDEAEWDTAKFAD
jgi:hypothetical protein